MCVFIAIWSMLHITSCVKYRYIYIKPIDRYTVYTSICILYIEQEGKKVGEGGGRAPE